MKNLKCQRGELSLFWAAVFSGVVAIVGMGALFSMRYERNFFAEAWKRFSGTQAGQVLQQTQQAAEKSIRPETAAIRKCMVGGKPVYSNVECDSSNASTRKLELHDTRGIEAPKVPAASAPQAEGAQGLQDKMIEKATQR